MHVDQEREREKTSGGKQRKERRIDQRRDGRKEGKKEEGSDDSFSRGLRSTLRAIPEEARMIREKH